METIWVELVLIAAAILANGFFSGAELALVSARASRLAELRADAVSGAERALALKKDPERFLATIQIAITLVGTLASAVGGAAAVEALTPWLQSLTVPGAARWGGPVALGLMVLLITFVSLVLGELTPKALALRNPEIAACRVARPIQWLMLAVAGPSRLLTASTRVVLTLLGQRETPQAPLVSEEEVKYLLREGAAHGVFEPQERDLIHRVFEFTDTAVRSIMVPRPSIVGLDISTPPSEVLTRAAALGRTRLPVFRGSVEDTVGIVTLKDLFDCAARGTPPVLERLVHPPLFVPELARVSELLRHLQRQRANLALVVDEYGQVVGLITIEDLVEEIVGEIRDERESAHPESVSRLPDGSYIIEGAATIRDLRDRVGLPLEVSPEYQTVAGFVMHRIGSVPRAGMTVVASGYRWTVVSMDGPRVTRIKAEPARA